MNLFVEKKYILNAMKQPRMKEYHLSFLAESGG